MQIRLSQNQLLRAEQYPWLTHNLPDKSANQSHLTARESLMTRELYYLPAVIRTDSTMRRPALIPAPHRDTGSAQLAVHRIAPVDIQRKNVRRFTTLHFGDEHSPIPQTVALLAQQVEITSAPRDDFSEIEEARYQSAAQRVACFRFSKPEPRVLIIRRSRALYQLQVH